MTDGSLGSSTWPRGCRFSEAAATHLGRHWIFTGQSDFYLLYSGCREWFSSLDCGSIGTEHHDVSVITVKVCHQSQFKGGMEAGEVLQLINNCDERLIVY